MTWRHVLFLLGLALAPLVGACNQAPPGKNRPLILVTVDTLRSDRLGVYGGSLETPALDRPGREGALVETALASFGRTTQSVGSILTGLHPLHHGADGLGMPLPSKNETLAEILQKEGYKTAAFVTNLILKPGMGFEQGFQLFSNPPLRWTGDSSMSLTDEALAWLESQKDSRQPFFLWLHYFDPHWTYEPDESYLRRLDPGYTAPFQVPALIQKGEISWGRLIFSPHSFLTPREIEHIKKRYDAEILQTDAAIARLWSGLSRLGLMDRAVVVVTSDHGESLGEHEYWFAHGEYLYDSSLQVPLMWRAPGLIPPGTHLKGPVRLEDIAPTTLDLLRIEPPPHLDGVSLAESLRQGGMTEVPSATVIHLADHLLVRAENPRRPIPGREGRWRAIREKSWKLIRIPLGQGQFEEELFDLATDPGETHNLISQKPEEASRLRRRLESLSTELPTGTSPEPRTGISAPDSELLRSLGYAH